MRRPDPLAYTEAEAGVAEVVHEVKQEVGLLHALAAGATRERDEHEHRTAPKPLGLQ